LFVCLIIFSGIVLKEIFVHPELMSEFFFHKKYSNMRSPNQSQDQIKRENEYFSKKNKINILGGFLDIIEFVISNKL